MEVNILCSIGDVKNKVMISRAGGGGLSQWSWVETYVVMGKRFVYT